MTFEQTHPIFALSDMLVDELCELYPDSATYLGVDGFDDRWPDLSPDGVAQAAAAVREMRRQVEATPHAENRWEELAILVAKDELDRMIQGYDDDDPQRDLNSISSSLQNLRETFDHMKQETADDWSNIAARLEGMPSALGGYTATLDEGRRRGMAVPIRQVEEAIRQAEVQASSESAFLGLGEALAARNLGNNALADRVRSGVATAQNAYAELAEYLRTIYAPNAPHKDAAGPDRYRQQVRKMLGTVIDPQEAYDWGWSEVAALRTRMETVAEEIAPGGGIPGALDVLKHDETRAAATPQDLVTFLSARVNESLERLADTHFDVPDHIRRCDVKLAPPGGALGAYYVGPSEDFTRPGSVWWSILPNEPRPLYEDVTTAYHEGFPGHHLQVGIQASLDEHLSRFHRRWVWMPGTGEGWALYAERLMDELGYLDKPDYVFGYLAGQIHRACRVVVDIGCHLELPIPTDQPFHPGEPWAYETAVEMLVQYATLDTPYAESEVTRYLGWPAQAIAYKLGEREILRLRNERSAAAGDAFDLRAFHARLLEVGPVGLDLMRRFVLDG